jgi:hypothetical protein
MSTQDEREVVMNCLTLGAIDYLVKPLRHNELRHIWTRVWWWRRVRVAYIASVRDISEHQAAQPPIDTHPPFLAASMPCHLACLCRAVSAIRGLQKKRRRC